MVICSNNYNVKENNNRSLKILKPISFVPSATYQPTTPLKWECKVKRAAETND